jgi:thioredoxin 1
MLSPIIDELSELYSQVTFGKLNVDENNALARKFNIMAIPTLLFFKGGKEFSRKAASLRGVHPGRCDDGETLHASDCV